MWHAWGKREIHTGFFVGKVKERLLQRPGYRWEDTTEIYLKIQDGKAWCGFMWLRIGTSGGFL
jgi:hypothetical protein